MDSFYVLEMEKNVIAKRSSLQQRRNKNSRDALWQSQLHNAEQGTK
jgi:hypothetical protein